MSGNERAIGSAHGAGSGAGVALDLGGFKAYEDNVSQLSEISRNSQTAFLALIAACAYSCLTIAATTDEGLLSNAIATPLPIIQVSVPLIWFYWVAPVILAVLFFYFHLYLEHFWRGIVRLPKHHPDGRGLHDYVYPWLISCAVIRGEIHDLSPSHRVAARLEGWLSVLLGWLFVPVVLLLYWGRFAAVHQLWGTLLHIVLLLLTLGFAMRYFFTARNALWQVRSNPLAHSDGDAAETRDSFLSGPQRWGIAITTALAALVIVYLSAAAFRSLSQDVCARLEARNECNALAPGRLLWEAVHVEPYAVVKEGRFVTKPADWSYLMATPSAMKTYLDGQRALVLSGRDLRNMNAGGAFMPGSRITDATLDFADLSHAAMPHSRLEGVTLRGAKLTDTALQYAQITDTRFDDVSAEAAHFDHATFRSSGSARPVRLSGTFTGATFDGATGDRLQINSGESVTNVTSLRGASLRSVDLKFAHFNRVDFGTATIKDQANLTNSTFVDTDFSGATIQDSFLSHSTFTRCRFTQIDDAQFVEAVFENTQFGQDQTSSPESEKSSEPTPTALRKRMVRFQAALASFDAATRFHNLEFEAAELRNARFSGTILDNVRFSSAAGAALFRSDLSGAVFDKVDLGRVDFSGVDLSGADLSTARNVSARLLQGACGNAQTRLPPGFSVQPCTPRKRS